jgi:enoyl-CoA hydratase/carnithine racemase
MNLPQRRNALSEQHLADLLDAFEEVAASDARGVLLAGAGPVFSSGHDFADMVDRDRDEMQRLLELCGRLMQRMQSVPQVVLARVHGPAYAAGCQLVASADLAVAAESATFATPGGSGGWFCHTPMVAVGRVVPRKRAVEMAFTGEPIDATTAADWGLVNRVVPDDQLDEACLDLLRRATGGSRASKAVGKQALYTQLAMSQGDAYDYATHVMASTSQHPDAQENMAAFIEKRPPRWTHRAG